MAKKSAARASALSALFRPDDVCAFNAAVKRLPPWRSLMADAIARDSIDDMALLVLDHADSGALPKQHLDLLAGAMFGRGLTDANRVTVRKIGLAVFGYDMRPQ